MKTRTMLYCLSAVALIAFFALFCQSPSNPRDNPGNAEITSFNTSFRGGDTVIVPSFLFIAYRCTVNIQLPELVDSLIIKRKTVDSIVLDTALTAADTQFRFNFISHKFGRDTLVAYIVRKNGAGNDTMLKPYFSPHLYFGVYSICHLNTCPTFDTIWADTCAYDRDSVNDPYSTAGNLNWPQDTIHGVNGVYRMVKIYGQHCISIGIPPVLICFPVWTRKWVVEYDDNFLHLCSSTGTDTLKWTVINYAKDTVTQPLVLHRGTTCP
jgi:hypothetical protein